MSSTGEPWIQAIWADTYHKSDPWYKHVQIQTTSWKVSWTFNWAAYYTSVSYMRWCFSYPQVHNIMFWCTMGNTIKLYFQMYQWQLFDHSAIYPGQWRHRQRLLRRFYQTLSERQDERLCASLEGWRYDRMERTSWGFRISVQSSKLSLIDARRLSVPLTCVSSSRG